VEKMIPVKNVNWRFFKEFLVKKIRVIAVPLAIFKEDSSGFLYM